MAEESRQVVIAPREAVRSQVPPDWQDQVAHTPGITVLGSSVVGMEVRATDAALQDAQRRLGHLLHFEEPVERRPAG